MTEQKTEVEILREGLEDLRLHMEIVHQDPRTLGLSSTYRIVCRTLDKANQALAEAEKAVRRPTWNLTQILNALEEAGLPEPESFDNGFGWDLNGVAEKMIYIDWVRVSRLYYVCVLNWTNESNDFEQGYNSLPEAIEKLTELLKDN